MAIKPKRPINYLNNKDILKEIHKSKTTYCSFVSPEYHQYDYIVDSPDLPITDSLASISSDVITKAKENRAFRHFQETGEKIEPSTVSDNDLIFRVMTWDHIPVSQKQPRVTVKKKAAKDIFVFIEEENDFSDLEDSSTLVDVDDLVHVKVNFPPFQHYKYNEDGEFQCVGKSHWTGGMENGHFSTDHGQITNKLAKMYMMLCAKYSMKFNWRGYTYRDEMEASAILQLTYVGLRFNEAKSANPFAYYTAAITNSFCRVLNTEKKVQNIRDDILQANGMSPSFARQAKNSTVSSTKAK